ncbi:MAG: VOC family protein [Wenzhouxiangella sp.]|nr:VOC family protein [Wenzhouxiangella sp.]MCH8478875.1 VOC family protein [Wenzhouxiangella sp.]
MKVLTSLVFGVTLLATSQVQAAPVPEEERGPVDVRRTTLMVRDIDKSLAFYRDALGLTVIYDQELGGGVDDDGNEQEPTARLALLRANDTFVGVIGLYHRYTDPAAPPPENRRPVSGDIIIVVNATDLEERFEKVRNTPGVTVHVEPELRTYPTPDGKGIIPVMFSAVYDPDGFFIEVNQIMGTPAGQE